MNMDLSPAGWLLLVAAGAALCLLVLARDRRRGRTRPAVFTLLRKVALCASVVAGCTAAAAGSLLDAPPDESSSVGPDVVVLLDVSMSMLATDIAPSRLAAARTQLTSLFEADRTPRRLALVAFAADARIVCPLTADRQAFLESLSSTTHQDAGAGGSDPGLALDRALSIITPGGRNGAIVLVTDGEPGPKSGADQGAEAAHRVASANVELTVVGVGSLEGASVPVRGSTDTVAVGADGRAHLSMLDEVRLQGIAAAAGGRYQRLTPGAGLSVALPDRPTQADLSARPFGTRRWSTAALFVALTALVLDTALWWWRGSPEIWG